MQKLVVFPYRSNVLFKKKRKENLRSSICNNIKKNKTPRNGPTWGGEMPALWKLEDTSVRVNEDSPKGKTACAYRLAGLISLEHQYCPQG